MVGKKVWILDDIDITIPLSVSLSVCLSFCLCVSCLCIVLKWLKISTLFLLHTSAPCRSQIVLKFGLHWSTPSSSYFVPKWPNPVDFSRGDIRWQIAAEWWDIVHCSQWTVYREPPSLFPMVRSMILYNLFFPRNGVCKCTAHEQLHDKCCHLANMIGVVAFCQITSCVWYSRWTVLTISLVVSVMLETEH